jgi:hypothetical protein
MPLQNVPLEPLHEPLCLSVKRHRITDYSGDRLLDIFLYAAVMGLTLPTMKTSAQVLNDQGDSLHSRKNRRHHKI